MIDKFRSLYPQGSLISELLTIYQGKYVVRVVVQDRGITLSTGLAAADSLEKAEDSARMRALNTLDLDSLPRVTASGPLAGDTDTAAVERPQPALKDSPSSDGPDSPSVLEASQTATVKDLPVSAPRAAQYPQLVPPPVVESPPTVKLPATVTSHLESASSNQENEQPSLPWDEPLAPEIAGTTPSAEISPPVAEPAQPEVEGASIAEAKTATSSTQSLDYSDIIVKTDIEMKRLGWTKEDGRKHLIETYGKKSRPLLSDQELWEFLKYLESLPTPS
jgi:hypothetical protein